MGPLERRPRRTPVCGAPARTSTSFPPLARLVVALVLALGSALLPAGREAPLAHAQTVSRETLPDYEVVNGYFFTQTGGSPSASLGYAVSDEGGIPFWSEFQRLGGVDALGYPVSRRFLWDGYVVQAFQKVVLQWRPELGHAVFVNVLDELTRAGKDDWLASFRGIPKPATFPGEAALSFQDVARARLALLESSPALQLAYLSAPNPIETNGLPVAPIVDVGPALVLRAQRKAFQLWKVATPWARAGDVTVVNGGDLAKEADLYPAAAAAAEPATAQIAAPPGSATRMTPEEVAALRRVVDNARPAVVKLTDGLTGAGTGIVFDPTGLVLTNSHVVTAMDVTRLHAIFPSGITVPARPLGADDWTDVAVVRLEPPVGTSAFPFMPLGSALDLQVGQRVVGIGYAPLFPGPPSAKTGVVRSLAGEIQVDRSFPLFNLIQSNTTIYPGDSGGPLLDTSGRVVGVNSAVQVSWIPRRGRELTGFSIPIDGAMPIAQQLVATGSVPRPHIGITPVDVTPLLASSLVLPVTRGVLLRDVLPESPAEAAGLVPGDIIVAMDGLTVTGLADLRRYMIGHRAGDAVRFSVIDRSLTRRSVTVVLAERPTQV